MPFFQFDIKLYRLLLVIAALALYLVAGCVAQGNNIQPQAAAVNESSPSLESVSGQKSIPYKKSITGIEVKKNIEKKEDKIVEIQIQGNQKLAYTSIKQPFPFAICLYLPETSIEPGLISGPIPGLMPGDIEDETIGGLKLSYADQNKTTVKIQILLNRDIPYEVLEDGDKLRIILSMGKLADISSDKAPSKEIAIVSAKENTKQDPLVLSGKSVMTHIEFNTENSGKSYIRVDTSHPIKYDITRKTDKIVNLNLYNTKIPSHHQRPILTKYFNSAVESIEPKTIPGKSDDSRIEINIRNQVPYQIVQDQNTIRMVFEPSGDITEAS